MADPVIVDTSVWVDHFRQTRTPEVDLLRSLLPSPRVVIGDLVMMEVLRGVREDLRHARIRRALLECVFRSMADRHVVLRSADHYRDLRRKGITVRSTIDCLIATYCIETGSQLLHSDRDFDPFEEHLGLRVVPA